MPYGCIAAAPCPPILPPPPQYPLTGMVDCCPLPLTPRPAYLQHV